MEMNHEYPQLGRQVLTQITENATNEESTGSLRFRYLGPTVNQIQEQQRNTKMLFSHIVNRESDLSAVRESHEFREWEWRAHDRHTADYKGLLVEATHAGPSQETNTLGSDLGLELDTKAGQSIFSKSNYDDSSFDQGSGGGRYPSPITC